MQKSFYLELRNVFTLDVVMGGVKVSVGSSKGSCCWRWDEQRFGEFTGSEVQRVRWAPQSSKGYCLLNLSSACPVPSNEEK